MMLRVTQRETGHATLFLSDSNKILKLKETKCLIQGVTEKTLRQCRPSNYYPLFPLSWDSRIIEQSSVQCPNNKNNAEFQSVVKASVFKKSNLDVKSG